MTLDKHKLAIMLQMVFHTHSDHFFDAKLAHFNAVKAILTVLCHILPGYPSLTTRIQAHYELVPASFLVLCQHAIADLLGAAIAIINAL